MAEMTVGQVQQTVAGKDSSEEDAEPAEFEGSFFDMLQYIATCEVVEYQQVQAVTSEEPAADVKYLKTKHLLG